MFLVFLKRLITTQEIYTYKFINSFKNKRLQIKWLPNKMNKIQFGNHFFKLTYKHYYSLKKMD